MISFWRIFWLEFTSLARSGTLAILTAASVGWMFVMPYIIRSDGTVEGARELYVRYALGGVLLLLVVALVSSATASIARERAEKRLQLTLVRPVGGFSVALGKISALTAAGGAVLALSMLILGSEIDASGRCFHVISPILDSPKVEAEAEYRRFMEDPETPDALRKAKKSAVMQILEQRAIDRYESVPTNAVASWRFPIEAGTFPSEISVRMRFTAAYDSRRDVSGELRLGERTAPVRDITRSVALVPLTGGAVSDTLEFRNNGTASLLLRPRQDIKLLLAADATWWNLLRAWLVAVSALALIVSAGVLLGSALGRPVALFVAVVALIVGEMSPAVVERYPDPLGAGGFDRIGLVIAELVSEAVRPVSSMMPTEALVHGECVEWRDVARSVLMNLAVAPLFSALIALFVLSRKKTD